MSAFQPIEPARLSWRDGHPFADDFDDIYYTDAGEEETLRIFVAASGILEQAHQRQEVCVGELGFGSGLNFAILARELLHQTNARLRFISFEKHPLCATDWQQVIARRQTELPIYQELRAQTPPLLSGWHQRVLAEGRIILQVYHGEVADGLADLGERQLNPLDAWFLDGFSPPKNKAMWTPEVFQQLASLSHADTTVATFTVAGWVKRSLEGAGFSMHKVDQRPFRRESLAGVYQGKQRRVSVTPPTHVVVHGAGMAGAYTARHLAESGINVTVCDPQGIAGGASAMSATVLHSRLLSDRSPSADLRCAAFHYASTWMQRWPEFTPSGVLRVRGSNVSSTKFEKLCQVYAVDNPQQTWIDRLDARAASNLSGIDLAHDALWFPSAGVVDAPAVCDRLLQHPRIEFVAEQASFNPAATNIVCAGSASRSFPGCELLEITDVIGQLDWYAADDKVAELPIVGNGYVVPTPQGCVLGATYEHTPWAVEDASTHNLELNQHFVSADKLTWQSRRRGARCVSSDRNPVTGVFEIDEDGSTVWLNTALGSMGNTAGVLAAAAISANLQGWLAPLSAQVQHLLRPQRFRERQARRGIRHIKL